MKRISTLVLGAICCSTIIYAQAPPTAKSVLELVRKRTAALSPAYAPAPALKGTATPELLIAEADYNDDNGTGLELTDSARFIYGSKGKARFDHNNYEYIDLTALEYSPVPYFLSPVPGANNFDSSEWPHLFFDTLHHYVPDTVSGGMYRIHRQVASLNPDTSFSMVTNQTYLPGGTTSINANRHVMTYNAGRLAKVYGLYDMGSGIYDTTAVRTINYNGSGRIILDSIANDFGAGLQESMQTYYTYNGAGQYITKTQTYFNFLSGSLDTSNRINYTYYPSGQVKTMSYEQRNSTGIMQVAYRDSFAYTAGVPGFTAMYEEGYDEDGTVNFAYDMVTNRINSMNLKDSMTISVNFMGTDLDVAAIKLAYNANGNPVKGTIYDLMGGTTASVRNWYYKTSAPGVGVKPAQFAAVSVSPNPTTGVVTLNYAAAQAGTAVNVRIMNTAGQLVRAEAFTLQGTQQQLQLGNEAAPGMYLISVLDAQGNQLYGGRIVKQ